MEPALDALVLSLPQEVADLLQVGGQAGGGVQIQHLLMGEQTAGAGEQALPGEGVTVGGPVRRVDRPLAGGGQEEGVGPEVVLDTK